MLVSQHGILMPVRKLQRCLTNAGLRRKNVVESPEKFIIAAPIEEVYSSGKKTRKKTPKNCYKQ